MGDIKKPPFEELKNANDNVVNSLVEKIVTIIITLQDALYLNKKSAI